MDLSRDVLRESIGPLGKSHINGVATSITDKIYALSLGKPISHMLALSVSPARYSFIVKMVVVG